MKLEKNTTEENQESDIIVRVFYQAIKNWWFFLIVGILGGVAGYIYAINQRPVYQSYLSFALDEGGAEGGMSGAMGLAAQFGISLGRGAQDVFTGDNILQIMQSRRLIEDVLLSVDTFNNTPSTLIEYFLQHIDKSNKHIKDIHFYPGQVRNSFNYKQDSVLYKTFLDFQKNHIIARRPSKNLNIYELMVTSYNEKFSKIFTDNLIEKTNHFYTDIRSKKEKETLEILEKALPNVKGKLDAAITNKASTLDADLNTAFADAQVPILKDQINTQVYGTAYSELYKNLEMARFQYLKSIPLMQIIDPANYPMKKIKQSKIIASLVGAVLATFIVFIISTVMSYFKFKKTHQNQLASL